MSTKITSTEFRKNVSHYLNQVENGETFQLYRHGKLVAELQTTNQTVDNPSWKQVDKKLKVSGQLLSEAIVANRT